MKARLLLRDRVVIAEDAFADLRVWEVPEPVRGSDHRFKYALALVVGGECVLRYDNEAGKGDHRHLGGAEEAYRFVDAAALLADSWEDADRWMAARPTRS
jgi:hypothetical protein